MNILITGGSGFIGTNLIDLLLTSPVCHELGFSFNRLINLDALTYAANPHSNLPWSNDRRYTFVHGDINDSALVLHLLHSHQISAVIHLASESHVDRSIAAPESFATTNFLGSFRLLEAFRAYLLSTNQPPSSSPLSQSHAPTFLQVSTDEVFGSLSPNDPPFSPSSRFAPNSPYSAAKAGADLMARAYHHTYQLPVITTHCSNNFGPWQHPEKLIPLIISRAILHQPLPIYGNGSQIRDWIDVKDHCRALLFALWHGTPGSSYLIGANCEIPNLSLVHQLVDHIRDLRPDLLVPPAHQLITHVQDRPGHDTRYAIDSSHFHQATGWSPLSHFPDALRSTVSWYLNHLLPPSA